MNQNDFFAGSNLQRYVGRTVAEFVADLPERYEEVYPIDEPPGKLNGFALRFHDGRVVDVLCSDLKHVQRFSEQRRWDFEAFKKETISEIVESRPDTGREGE